MQIVHMQPLVSSLSASDRLVQPLRKDCFYYYQLDTQISCFHSHKLHKIKFLYMFQPSCATASLAVAQDGHLQRVTIPEAACVQFASLTS